MMYYHTKFGDPATYSMKDVLRTRFSFDSYKGVKKKKKVTVAWYSTSLVILHEMALKICSQK